MSKIGIFGGSFDPIHNGHLSIAKAALKECDLRHVILMPTKVSPFKVGHKMASSQDRVSMAELIANKNSDFVVSTIEAFDDRISYTYETMELFTNEYPDDDIYFIMGTDSFLSIKGWYKWEALVRKYAIIIGVRPGYKEHEMLELKNELEKNYDAEIHVLSNTEKDISSTEIRNMIRKGESITGLVPYEIERYIYEHRLYL